jgi:diacylglycerol kinase
MLKRQSLGDSFHCAWNGIRYAFKTQRNMKIHSVAPWGVIALGWYCGIQSWEWAVLVLTMGLVLAAELINTAVEKTVDLYTAKLNPLAGLAKDLAAGAVLVTAIAALIIAGIIFVPYFF